MKVCNCSELYFLSGEVVDYFFISNRYSLLFEVYPSTRQKKYDIMPNLVTRIATVNNFDILLNANTFELLWKSKN